MNQPAKATLAVARVSCLLACFLDLTVRTVYAQGVETSCVCLPPAPFSLALILALSLCLSSFVCFLFLFLFVFSLVTVSHYSSSLRVIPSTPHMSLVPMHLSLPPHSLPSLCSWKEETLW